jgi:hypothetical protein
MIVTPAEEKRELRKRLKVVLKDLPDYWKVTFTHVYPEYKGKGVHLRNVAEGLSLDKNVIKLMEELAVKLKPVKAA